MSFVKLLPYIIILILVIVLVIVIGLAGKKQQVPVIREVTNTYRVSEPVVTKIVRENVPAVIETLLVQDRPHEVAVYRDTVRKDKTTVDLDVCYDVYERSFDVNADIYSVRDSVFVMKEMVRETTVKPKLLGFASELGVNFEQDNGSVGLASVDVGVGVKIAGRYSIYAVVDTRRTVGLRFGVDF